jgi:hypothetical protein
MEINSVGRFVILLLQGVEELVDGVLFGPTPQKPTERSESDYQDDDYSNFDFAAPSFRGIVEWSVEQGHRSPFRITDFDGTEVGAGWCRG